MKNILVTGGAGAIGRNLLKALYAQHGSQMVIAGYNRTPLTGLPDGSLSAQVDVYDKERLISVVEEHDLDDGEIYHLAALLSIAAEKDPERARRVNMGGLKNVLDVAREYDMRVFWPSSIAVFGSSAPKHNTPQNAPLDPEFEYGRNKVEGEKLLNQFFDEFEVDGRSVRYPGLLTPGKPGPGTTEYAIEMIYAAVRGEHYASPLRHDTELPMMDMRDATRAALEIMKAPKEDIKVRTSYNLSAMSFTPEELAEEIRKHIPRFKTDYKIDDLKQRVADSWPNSIDDSSARDQWGWNHRYGLPEMTEHMIAEIQKELEILRNANGGVKYG
ncbi:MAG: NAD-dependent epimerase/dehydratase family protein [Candidatus Aenigmarchaeota archaeon]|nr:NAD-dependent epimerase/dehydratase family protein [Candidatus Aenigmarchaeota archaeon]